MLYLVLAALIWGSSFPVITYALRDVSPILLLLLRFGLAFAVLLPYLYKRGHLRMLFHRDLMLIAIPNGLSYVLQFKAQELTTASKTALFVNSAPVYVAVLSAVFLHERFTRRQIVAAIIAMAGVVVTSTRLNFSDFSAINTGDVLAALVGLCWAVFIVFSGPALKRYGAFHLSMAVYFWACVLALPLLPFENLRLGWVALPAAIYLTGVTTLLAYFLYLRGIRSVSPFSTSVIILIEVVVAFFISHRFLAESFSPLETAGVVMVMVGVLLVLKRVTVTPEQ